MSGDAAVSYTHLDVYKRQDDDSVMGVGNGRETDQLNENKDDQVIKTDCKVSDDSISEADRKRLKRCQMFLDELFDKQNAKLDEMFKKQNEKWERDRCKLKENKESELKQVSKFDGENNNSGVSLSAKQVTVDKVSNSVNYDDVNKGEIMVNNNNNEVVENEVSMYDTLSNGGDNESRRLVGVSNGVVISVDELERELKVE